MAVVIADTSPLQYLFQLGLLDILHALYGSVLVPDAVRIELLVGRTRGIDVPDPADYTWMTIRSATRDDHRLDAFELDFGERAALDLAIETPGSIVIVDDGAARAAASALGIPITGTVGVLLLAKERGHVASIAAALSELERRGFRIAPALLACVLALAGESSE